MKAQNLSNLKAMNYIGRKDELTSFINNRLNNGCKILVVEPDGTVQSIKIKNTK